LFNPLPAAARAGNIPALSCEPRGDAMGRIGRSYPRFEEASGSAAGAAEPQASCAFQTLGAIVGIVCALAFIAWLLAR
jgi:hypothetical protein